jgi:hypothetical protein
MTPPEPPPSQPRTYTLIGVDGKAYESETPGRFGGHRGSKLYGRLDCPSALRAIAGGGYVAYRVFFADETTALVAGYRPCSVCLPQDYQAWKAGRQGASTPKPQPEGPPRSAQQDAHDYQHRAGGKRRVRRPEQHP